MTLDQPALVFVPDRAVQAAALALCDSADAPCPACQHRAVGVLEAGLTAIDPSFALTGHMLLVRQDRWTLQHPLWCRPNLADCPVHTAVDDLDPYDLPDDGDYPVRLDEHGDPLIDVDARAYTHPDVLGVGVAAGWADPETDPTQIDWTARQATAAIPFRVVDGRPVNPGAPTGIRYGRGELGHWGEGRAADALVTATGPDGTRWIVMVERADGHGWALPGGGIDPGELPADAAVRELAEETGLRLPGAEWMVSPPRLVPDPRATDEAWMVTYLASVDLGTCEPDRLPPVTGADDAKRAAWVRADSYDVLVDHLAAVHGGTVFPAHREMLTTALTGEPA